MLLLEQGIEARKLARLNGSDSEVLEVDIQWIVIEYSRFFLATLLNQSEG